MLLLVNLSSGKSSRLIISVPYLPTLSSSLFFVNPSRGSNIKFTCVFSNIIFTCVFQGMILGIFIRSCPGCSV